VTQNHLYGFVEVADLVFEGKSAVVIDPSEERLKSEFEGVHKTIIPIHTVIRIDEVEKRGVAKITPMDGKGGNVVSYPGTPYSPGQRPGKDE
jgi:hypothetical protein